MKSFALFILCVICGCGERTSVPASSKPIIEPSPIVAGTMSLTFGEVHEYIVPPPLLSAGSKWLQTSMTYTNTSDHSIWILAFGYDDPARSMETRVDANDAWIDYGIIHVCGTGSRDIELKPGASHSFKASLPERYVDQEFRVLLPYRLAADDPQWLRAASDARRLNRPDTE